METIEPQTMIRCWKYWKYWKYCWIFLWSLMGNISDLWKAHLGTPTKVGWSTGKWLLFVQQITRQNPVSSFFPVIHRKSHVWENMENPWKPMKNHSTPTSHLPLTCQVWPRCWIRGPSDGLPGSLLWTPRLGSRVESHWEQLRQVMASGWSGLIHF